jgi:hypothetical protein
MPQIPIPPRTAVDAYFAHLRAMGVQQHLDVTFDADLGELVEGHHVVVRGIERGPGEAVLHYEFVPAVQEHERQDKGPFFGTGWCPPAMTPAPSTTTTTPAGSILRARQNPNVAQTAPSFVRPSSLSDYSSPSAGGWRPRSSPSRGLR